MICTFISRILGFLRIFVISLIVGGKGAADVINGVFNLPNNLRKLFAEGALSSAYIPTLSSAVIEDDSGERPRGIARNLISFLLVILVPLVIAAAVFARPLVHILLHFDDPHKMDMAVDLFRWVFSYILFISLSAVLMGALNAKNSFIIPAITPILFSICVISSIIFLYGSLGIFALAVGILAGGVAQILFQLPLYFKKDYDIKPDFRFNNKDFKQILKKWAPALFSSAIFAINQVIAIYLASYLEDGSVTALSNAVVFIQLPLGIFSNSIITVLFPRMSRQAALNNIQGLRESMSYGLRFIFILLIPSTLVLIFLGNDIIRVLLQYGKFTAQDTARTSWVLAGYALGLFSAGALFLCQRFFYSFKDFRSPAIVAIVIVGIDIFFSIILMNTPLRVAGLAVANSIAFTVGMILLLVLAKRRLERFYGRKILITSIKTLIAMIPLAGIILIYQYVIKDVVDFTKLTYMYTIITLIFVCVLAMGVTALMYILLKVDIFYDLIKRRVNGIKEAQDG
ncbi:MAG: murein biosynthesis integral membrane protein MurJ [Spirochaetales bacterium]|nr:murein biosynthesis integral membrane protein MurJ [Spirochaetales bacterium]